MRFLQRGIARQAAILRSRRGWADLAVFHEFAPPPSGGGNQFLNALLDEFAGRGMTIESNRLSRRTTACLLNSFNFDFARLSRSMRTGVTVVHRVDGPIGVYRGFDDGTDRSLWELNQACAAATIFQSRYSLERHRELGYDFASPHVIRNATDEQIFNTQGRIEWSRERKTRLIATSWSDNPNKGGETYRWLEEHLDWDRFELTFVGRSNVTFERARHVPPVDSRELASLLRAHDVFVFASLHEACSNALTEALACGLPALFVDSGSNAEVVGEGGLSFRDCAELPSLLDRLLAEYERRQASISVPSLEDVADAYADMLGLVVA